MLCRAARKPRNAPPRDGRQTLIEFQSDGVKDGEEERCLKLMSNEVKHACCSRVDLYSCMYALNNFCVYVRDALKMLLVFKVLDFTELNLCL